MTDSHVKQFQNLVAREKWGGQILLHVWETANTTPKLRWLNNMQIKLLLSVPNVSLGYLIVRYLTVFFWKRLAAFLHALLQSHRSWQRCKCQMLWSSKEEGLQSPALAVKLLQHYGELSPPFPVQHQQSAAPSSHPANNTHLGCSQQRWVSERGAVLAELSEQFCVLIVSFGLSISRAFK